jgi:hypothetical protein
MPALPVILLSGTVNVGTRRRVRRRHLWSQMCAHAAFDLTEHAIIYWNLGSTSLISS